MSKETVAARTMTWPEFLTRFEQSWGSAPPDVEQIFEMLESWLPECDKKVLALPEVRASFRLMLPEAMRQGVPGWALDSWNMARPWGFRVEDIRVPTYLWHGELDRAAPVEAGRYLANAIPNCKATFYPDQGHLLAPECWHDILPPLIG